MMIRRLLCVASVSALSAPPLKHVARWPPEGTDASARWSEGEAGPLGRGVDAWAESRFRAGLLKEVGGDDTYASGFEGIVEIANLFAKRGAEEARKAARRVLCSLFPDWPPSPEGGVGLLYWFDILFARPFPAFSAKLNAAATFAFGHWLMGPLELGDLEEERAEVGDGRGQLVLVRRCRFLEESRCASVCVNACKMPTQDFFNEDMGVPLRIEPDYETLECRFKFGLRPTEADEAEARSVACLATCPNNGRLLHLNCDKM
ncbi:hypothetical protein CTAYLR_010429 [Chrysophaeum taylorii]|uniref:Beta-carotene isomerase D27-like C-terminal domain-containing protein n=1 Tax=Chrysophaeum taylorii TaxID=2483200 RepID=A0AAD7U9Q7_9STRA|nr:hypothetical protein CTAYLR_010429 [Chrysophaeum taylorii]